MIDGTFGAGGHSSLFQENCRLLFSMDRDSSVIKYNTTGINLIIDKFSNLDQYIMEKPDLIHCDLGLSMMQIMDHDRGFSFMHDGPLNMNASEFGVILKDRINVMKPIEMERILRSYGDLKNAKSIASSINRYRIHSDITTTRQLSEASGCHNYGELARIFQAFRIYNNDEIYELETLLNTAKLHSKMVSIITFHSLEAKIVYSFLKTHCGVVKKFKPSNEEVTLNPSSRSAILYFGIFKNEM